MMFSTQALLDEIVSKYEEDYDAVIYPQATKLISPYKELDCEYINKRTSEEASKYEELLSLLNKRLIDIEARSDEVASLLADQQNNMTSLSKIDEQVDVIPVNSLSSSDVNQLLMDLQVCAINSTSLSSCS